MELLKGAAVSARIRQEVETLIKDLDRTPVLAIVRVGEKPDDLSYERSAVKKMEAFGLKARSYVFDAEISDTDFKKAFAKINEDPEVDGILVLRPLPKQIRETDIERMIDPAKDVDGISPASLAGVFAGDETGFAPCTAEAVVEMLKAYGIPIAGRRAVVVGRSMVVGRPLAMLLLKENATVTICHTKTEDLPAVCRQAQILAAAAGRPRMLGRDHVGKGAAVLDVGINVDPDGNLCGDVDLAAIEDIAAAATPVPGGIGAVTTAVLARHTALAAGRRQKAAKGWNGRG